MKELCNADSEMASVSFLTKETVHLIVEVSTINKYWIRHRVDHGLLFSHKNRNITTIPFQNSILMSKCCYIHSVSIFWHFNVNIVIFSFLGDQEDPTKPNVIWSQGLCVNGWIMSFPEFKGFKIAVNIDLKIAVIFSPYCCICLTFSAYLPALAVNLCYDTLLVFLWLWLSFSNGPFVMLRTCKVMRSSVLTNTELTICFPLNHS